MGKDHLAQDPRFRIPALSKVSRKIQVPHNQMEKLTDIGLTKINIQAQKDMDLFDEEDDKFRMIASPLSSARISDSPATGMPESEYDAQADLITMENFSPFTNARATNHTVT